jgi:uncharacterized membrane protein
MDYNHFMEDKAIRDCLSIILLINENSSFGKIKSIWNKISKKISNLSSDKKKKIIQSFVISAIALAPMTNIIKLVLDDPKSKEEIIQVIDDMEFHDATKMKLSQNGRDMIKDYKKLRGELKRL